jgi:hypothetical protein
MRLLMLNLNRANFRILLGLRVRKALVDQNQNADGNKNDTRDFHRIHFKYRMIRTDRKRCYPM